jgi:cholesterol oxidase
VDMRTSAGMPTATHGWSFEDMARVDIPAAIDFALKATGRAKVDVVAHCMGSAMFCMSLLDKDSRLHEKIGRAVLSQIGPALLLTPANVFRAYMMRYVRYFLPLEDYTFRVETEKPSLTSQLLDRVLATLPYPRDEYSLENPILPPGKATPWAGTRHRMDALYSRTFKLSNLSPQVLDHIDDFFGPLSVGTVSQVIHFARFQTITNRKGFNEFVVPGRLKEQLSFPILSIHGEENGLADVATLELMREKMEGAGFTTEDISTKAQEVFEAAVANAATPMQLSLPKASYITWAVKGHGHQDCLIGKQARGVCNVIAQFLKGDETNSSAARLP